MSFALRILTPDQTLFLGQAEHLRVPTPQGYVGIRSGHAPLYTTLAPGEGSYVTPEHTVPFVVFGGILEIDETHQVTLLGDAEAIDTLPTEASIQTAIARAEEAMKRPIHANDLAYAEAAAQLARELLRHKLATKYRRS